MGMKFDWVPVTRAEQNCSLLWCEETRRAAVVDPGGDIPSILELLEWEELTLDLVLVTHGHWDHAGGAAQLAARTGARIEGPHRGDAPLVADLAAQGERFRVRTESYTPHRWLEHGDTVRFGAVEIEVLHCPGHSQGHVAYFHRESRQAFVGDILFRGQIGAWNHPNGDLMTLLGSIRERLFPLGDDVRFLPGHGEPSTFGHERAANPFVGDAAMERLAAKRAG